jgi:hypothetical protein
MSRSKPVPGAVEVLQEALDSAKAGEVTDVYVAVRYREGAWDTDWYTTDIDAMAFELRSETIRLRSRG